jgi:hypothetical protein
MIDSIGAACPRRKGMKGRSCVKVFATGGDALNDADGFGRAFRSTAVECADARQQREFAVLR